MTAQINDIFDFENQKYNLVAMTEGKLFDPEEHGFHPAGWMTACYRGYFNEYTVSKEGLFLSKMTIFSDQYPEFDGVKPEPERIAYKLHLEDTRPEYKDKPYLGPYCYNKLNYRINYTGKMVLGKDFIRDYYIHMGFQRAWAYETLKEFVFENGLLTEVYDHSAAAEDIRKQIDDDPEGFAKKIHGNIVDFVESSFSLDYDIKAWWL